MAEGTYEYECMRAELLGIEQPDYDEFMKKKQELVQEEEQDIENLKEAEHEEEQLKNVSGGLEELTSILQVTQKRINRFKASCGSLTNLLKIKIGHASTSESAEDNVKDETSDSQEAEKPAPNASANGRCSEEPRKSDLAKALDNHVDKLDAMLEKAETAQYSMSYQNKEMKRFLK